MSDSQTEKIIADVVGGSLSAPDWYPQWARRLAELYFSGTTCLFVLHGNVHDLLYCPAAGVQDRFSTLTDFLATQVFGAWDLVAGYDLAAGLRPIAGSSQSRLHDMVKYLSDRLGTAGPLGPSAR